MNETLLALLTIAANTIITYFLLNRQEKRLARKLFEDQVKFQKLHEKRLEVLETLHKKFRDYANSVNEMIRQARSIKSRGNNVTKADLDKINAKVTENFNALLDYFRSIKLFLPTQLEVNIHNMFNSSEDVHDLVRLAIFTENWNIKPNGPWVSSALDLAGPNASDISEILSGLSAELTSQTYAIETYYRYISEIEKDS